MKAIKEMTQSEILAEISDAGEKFTDSDYNALENNLILKAYVLGWTGDPLKQPAESVLSSVRQVLSEKPDHKI